MLYVPLLCFQLCALTNIISLWISIDKQLQILHHLTTVSTADLVTSIEHLVFWFYNYHQNSRSSEVSSITPTWDNRDCFPFVLFFSPKTTIKCTEEHDYMYYTRFVYKTNFRTPIPVYNAIDNSYSPLTVHAHF